jgi:hypothetical protein
MTAANQTLPASNQTSTPSDELIELVWNICEVSKKDLEKNWIYQMILAGISLSLVFGLGRLLSKYFFQEEGRENIFYIIIPMLSLYLFLRFGALLSNFSAVRTEFENLSKTYLKNNRINIDPSTIFNTNSYFEFYHREGLDVSIIIYCLFAPIILSASHASSIYMIWKQVNSNGLAFVGLGFSICSVYSIIIVMLYYIFWRNNKKNKFVASSIGITIFITFILVALIFNYADTWRFA